MTTQAHAEAGLDLLRAVPNLKVYDGAVRRAGAPLPEPPYVLVYTFRRLPTGLAAPDKIRLTGNSRLVEMELYCHCVGENAYASRAIQDLVEAALLDVRPAVAGRLCNPIRFVEGSPTDRNEQTGHVYIDQTDVYGWWSVPSV